LFLSDGLGAAFVLFIFMSVILTFLLTVADVDDNGVVPLVHSLDIPRHPADAACSRNWSRPSARYGGGKPRAIMIRRDRKLIIFLRDDFARPVARALAGYSALARFAGRKAIITSVGREEVFASTK